MKWILATTILFATMIANATPFSFRGVYSFKGNVVVSGRITYDIVDTRQPDSRTRLDEIRARGGECQLINSTTMRCLTHFGASDVPAASVERIRRQNQGFAIALNEVTAPPSLVSQAPSLTEWSISQRGKTRDGEFTQYRYLELTGGLSKLVLPGTPEPLWLNTTDGRTLRKFETVSTTESRWRFHRDSAEVVLEL